MLRRNIACDELKVTSGICASMMLLRNKSDVLPYARPVRRVHSGTPTRVEYRVGAAARWVGSCRLMPFFAAHRLVATVRPIGTPR